MIISFNVLAPPSANRIWKVGKGRIYRSKEYKSWLADAAWLTKGPGGSEPLQGPISVELVIHPQDKRLRDIDNYAKPCLDFLEHIGLIENDRQVERLLITRGEIMLTHHVSVTVCEST